MHASRYNVTVTSEYGERLLFNSATGAFAVLGSDVQRAYDAPDEADAALVSQLTEVGFLTDDTPEAELARIQDAFDAERADESTLELVIAPTYACNFRCPYCYEQGHNAIAGVMSDEVIDALCDFVASRWEATHFVALNVQWYGGDPSLALDRVEEISRRLIAFCDERGIVYGAMMLTNCNLIDEQAVSTLVSCRIGEVFITVDGPEDIHNARRVAADGSNSFARQIEAARLCLAAGMRVRANMNADKVNLPRYPEIATFLSDELGIELTTTMLCDYGHFFGSRDFKRPAFDLFTHEEYARLNHDAFVERGFSPDELRTMMSPVPRFCRGQRDAYFVIDTIGDVYACDGYMGEKDHVIFNLLDGYEEDDLHRITFDASRDERCCACELLPLCHGNCIWERRKTEMPCHPLKYTIDDYLRDWRSCFGDVNPHGLTLLALPYSGHDA